MHLKTTSSPDSPELAERTLPFQHFILMVLVVLAGVLLAVNLAPLWLPGLTSSTSGNAPQVYWFLSRGSAISAFWLLWLSMGMGIIITNKMAQIWPGIPPAYEVHQYASLLGMGLALFHALILLGDRYINYQVFQVLVPFASAPYRPTWVGFGQLALYVWAVVNISFYVRKQIGKTAWRLIHFVSYASFLAVLLHGIFSGTDSPATWVHVLYWGSGASLLLLTIYRILIVRFSPNQKMVNKPRAGSV
jgi:predicted ferric reductase